MSGVFRRIPIITPDLDTLNLPTILKRVLRQPSGLILVTGPASSGKSTTLAALLDFMNREEFGHLMTIEDPIEFVHTSKNCMISQREVGVDTRSLENALSRVSRQDPDFVLVGELNSIEVIKMALGLAETGHLVFATIAANGVTQAINRLINAFAPEQQSQARQVLSFTLRAAISQVLVPKSFESGRVLAYEILVPTTELRNLIQEDKVNQIYSHMQKEPEDEGMQTLNQSLTSLVKTGQISRQSALESSIMPDELVKML